MVFTDGPNWLDANNINTSSYSQHQDTIALKSASSENGFLYNINWLDALFQSGIARQTREVASEQEVEHPIFHAIYADNLPMVRQLIEQNRRYRPGRGHSRRPNHHSQLSPLEAVDSPEPVKTADEQ